MEVRLTIRGIPKLIDVNFAGEPQNQINVHLSCVREIQRKQELYQDYQSKTAIFMEYIQCGVNC